MSTEATPAAAPAGQPKITLHWLEQSRAQRIVWLLEECKVPYEIKTYKRINRLAPPELKKIHPMGKSPVVTVEVPGKAEPLVLAESSAICEFMAEHFATHLIPTKWQAGKEGQVGGETEAFLRYRMLMHYAEGSLMSALLLRYLINALAGPEVPFFIRPVTKLVVGRMNSMFLDPNTKTNFDFVEGQLASSPDGGEWFCGKELSIVDIMMSFPLLSSVDRGGDQFDVTQYPKIKAYTDKVQQQPLYQSSIKKVEEATGQEYELVGF